MFVHTMFDYMFQMFIEFFFDFYVHDEVEDEQISLPHLKLEIAIYACTVHTI